jgi:hypothetical protein
MGGTDVPGRRVRISGTPLLDSRFAARRCRCLYRRLGVRYVYLVASIGALALVLITPATAAFFDFVWAHGSVADWGRTVVFALLWMALLAMFIEMLIARSALPLIDWVREGRPAKGADAAWNAALIRMPRAVRLATALAVVGALVPTYYALAQVEKTRAGWIAAAFLAVAAFIVITAAALYYLLGRQMLAPVVKDVSSRREWRFGMPTNTVVVVESSTAGRRAAHGPR